MRVPVQVLDDGVELARMKAVGIGERQQQSLYIDGLRTGVDVAAADRMQVQSAFACERIDRVCIVPGPLRHRRIGQVAGGQDAREALQAAQDEGGEHARAAERNAARAFTGQQVLVSDGKFVCERQRSLGGFQWLAAQWMRGADEQDFQLRQQRHAGVPIGFREFHAPRVAHRHAVGSGERVPDHPGRFRWFSLGDLRQPGTNLGKARFRRIGRPRFERGQAKS